MRTICAMLASLMLGCGTINSTIPLDKGEHAMGATFGGPLLTALGPPIPVPSLVIEGVSGTEPFFDRPTDVSYGLNATALAFGTIGGHFGSSWQLVRENGAIPNLTASGRAYIYSNHLDQTKPRETRQLYLMEQLDLTTSWSFKNHLFFSGLGGYYDSPDPELILAPFVGMELRSQKRFFCQWELRYMGVNRQPDIVDVTFASPGGYGAIATTFSAGWMLKGDRQ